MSDNVNADGRADALAELRAMAAPGERLLSVGLPYATFGVVLRPGRYSAGHASTVGTADCWRVAYAAPMGRWMVGKSERDVRRWVQTKGGTVTEVPGN